MDEVRVVRLGEQVAGNLRDIAIEEQRGAGVFFEHRQDLPDEGPVAAGSGGKIRQALPRRLVGRIVKEGLNLLPAGRLHRFSYGTSSGASLVRWADAHRPRRPTPWSAFFKFVSA